MIQWVSIHLWGHKEIKWKEILLNTGIWQVESEFQISYGLRPDIVLLTILFYGSGQEEHSVSPDPIFLINSITMCLEYEKLLWAQVTVMIDWNNIFVKWKFLLCHVLPAFVFLQDLDWEFTLFFKLAKYLW